MLQVKEVELSIVVPVKGQPGRCVGTLVRRVHSDMSLPEIIKGVRKEYGEQTEGCIYLDPENYRQSVHDWNIRHVVSAESLDEKHTPKVPEKIVQDALVEDLEAESHGYTCQD